MGSRVRPETARGADERLDAGERRFPNGGEFKVDSVRHGTSGGTAKNSLRPARLVQESPRLPSRPLQARLMPRQAEGENDAEHAAEQALTESARCHIG